MYGHYVDLFRCHSSMASHRIVLAYNCLEVAAKLGCYHRAVRRRQPGEELPDWIPTPEIPAGDSRLDYVDAFTLLGDAMHPAYGHPKTLAQAYDQVYYEGRDIGNLPLRGKRNGGPVRGGIQGGICPDRTPLFNTHTDSLRKIC